MKCPKCGEEATCDEVDIGVGIMKGNWRCDFCGWSAEEDLNKKLSWSKENRHGKQ